MNLSKWTMALLCVCFVFFTSCDKDNFDTKQKKEVNKQENKDNKEKEEKQKQEENKKKEEEEKRKKEEEEKQKQEENKKKEEEEKREAARRKQELIKAKRDKEYKEYSAKVERLFKWMICFSLFAVISAGYWYYKDYFFLTVQGGLLFTGPTKVLGKAIIEFILSIMLCFLAPALLVYFIVDLKQDDEEK